MSSFFAPFRHLARRAPRGRRGIALVIVLGLLALLLISTVTFTISMRVERNAASHMRHASIARIFAKTALSQAISAIDGDIIDTDGNVEWRPSANSDDGLLYTYEVGHGKNQGRSFTLLSDTLISIDHDTVETNQLGQVGTLATAEAASFIPPGLLYKTLATKINKLDGDGFTSIRRPEWIPIEDGGGSIIGRAAFLALNTTASLNVNVIGGETRKAGKSPAEIAIPTSSDTSSAASGIQAILGHGHENWYKKFLEPEVEALSAAGSGDYFESLAPFVAKAGDAKFTALDVFNYTVFTNFFEYPVFKANGDFDKVVREPCVNLHSPDGKPTLEMVKNNKSAVLLALVNALSGKSYQDLSEATTAEKRLAIYPYNALLDYLDEDHEMSTDECSELNVPGVDGNKLKFARPVSENMTLFSGIIVKMTLKRKRISETIPPPDAPSGAKPKATYEYTARFTPEICWMYPFMSTSPSGLSIHYKVAVANGRSNERKTPDKWKPLLSPEGGAFSWSDSFSEDELEGPTGGSEAADEQVSATCEIDVELASSSAGAADKSENDIQPELKFDILFAAQTRKGNTTLRSHPVDIGEFGSFGPDNDSSYYVIHVDTTTDKDNGYATAATFKPGGCSSVDKEEEITRYYWAEMLDPAYAWHDQDGCAGDEEQVRSCYRPSVDARGYLPSGDKSGGMEGKLIFMSAHKLKSQPGFGGISGLFENSGKPKFDHGLGPVAKTILMSPRAARGLKLNLDGVSFRSDMQGDEADPFQYQIRRFVRDGDLDSVGELAFLPVGPWQTLRLYDHGDYLELDKTSSGTPRYYPYSAIPNHGGLHYHDLLDRFSLAPAGGAQGYVDIRSAYPQSMDALKSLTFAFNDLPVNYPLKVNSLKRVKTTDAARLAAMLLKDAPCYRLSDMARLFDGDNYDEVSTILAATYGQNYGEFEREALLRNSCGLFSTRGNTFTILMRAESYSPTLYYKSTMGGNPNSSAVAIAQIWRDTVKDTSGHYPVLIQFFKILGN